MVLWVVVIWKVHLFPHPPRGCERKLVRSGHVVCNIWKVVMNRNLLPLYPRIFIVLVSVLFFCDFHYVCRDCTHVMLLIGFIESSLRQQKSGLRSKKKTSIPSMFPHMYPRRKVELSILHASFYQNIRPYIQFTICRIKENQEWTPPYTRLSSPRNMTII